MKHKKLSVFITAFALIAAVMMALPMTAYAKTDEGADCYGYDCEAEQAQTETVIPVIPEEPEEEPTPPREPQTFTPPGNMNLVDDFDGELAEDKQFITVVTRNGHFFYIIIDRAGERNNVHFLNQVDEYDLWAILNEEAPRPVIPAPVEPMPELVPDDIEEPEPQQDESGGNSGLVIVIVLLLAAGGGAYYYFKILKPKQGTTGTATTDLDEFVFDDDEDDLDDTVIMDETDFEDEMPDFTADPADFTFEAESEDKE